MGKEPKSLRSIRQMRKREPKAIEGQKKTMLIRGIKTSEPVMGLMKDIRAFRRDRSILYSRKHEILPFESHEEIEGFCDKADTSLFVFGSHNKKRPHNIVFGRTFDSKLLDMVEFGIHNYQSIKEVSQQVNVPFQVRPFLIFQGDVWETDETYGKVRNLLNDFFFENNKVEGIEVDKYLQITICFSILEDKRIVMKTYEVKIEGDDILDGDGRIIVDEIGPHAEFVMRRSSFADPELWKKATHVPKPKKKKENKNVKYDAVGNKRGKLYLDRQDLKRVNTKKRKLIRKDLRAPKAEVTGLNQKTENEFAS